MDSAQQLTTAQPEMERLRALFADPRTEGLGYSDLHRHLLALAERGRLMVVERAINKDTEMHPLVRWQFRGGLSEPNRKAFVFTNPVDSKGRKFHGSVVVAGLAGNREIYSVGMGVPVDRIGETWVRAMRNPLKPTVVTDAACHDVVVTGDALRKPGAALDSVPVPISTPGFDNAPYFSAGHWISKDPETGIQNLGTYRAQMKDPLRLGLNPSVENRAGIYLHWLKYKQRGEKMPAALIAGCPPVVSYTSVQKVPENMDELSVAGALAGTPIRVTRAKTVDLLVPAEAEWVIEGYVNTEYLEPEAPFGESHGYVNLSEYNAFMEITAITRRRHPVLTSFISQVTPSESGCIKRVAWEPMLLDHLQRQLGIQGIQRVSMHEPLTSLTAVWVIVVDRDIPETELWRALYGASQMHRNGGRWVIAVNEDIDPDNADAVLWAMSYRCQAQHDVKILDRKDPGHGPHQSRDHGETASVLIDATLKGKYPPIALPKREFMERARELWKELGLPDFTPESPWHGYDLGYWPPRLQEQARIAVAGDYFSRSEELRRGRRNDVAMNTPIED